MLTPLVTESLLVFSDVHLGSDIHDGAVNKARRSSAVDRDLVRLLAHYRRTRPRGGRWRIVIAGDFIDFIGMTIPATEGLETAPTEEELRHGLGSAADHAVVKLRRVAERHRDVFSALAAFVADGHVLALVHGNHDIEFHWDAVKDEFRRLLFAHIGRRRRRRMECAAFFDAVEFHPWFFYRDGVVYIEHGHQYDPFCATWNVMSPISPIDERRVWRGFSDTLLRYVVRPTRGMKDYGHETVGVVHYVSFAVNLGLSGMLDLGRRFSEAVRELFRLRRVALSQAAAALRAEHAQRVAKLAEISRLGRDKLNALLSLQEPPVTASIGGILASVLLDRIALAVAAMTLVVLALGLSFVDVRFLWGALAVIPVWAVLHGYLSARRRIDPATTMMDRAAKLSGLFPAAFVVMGHTHVPVATSLGHATYINVGSWSEEESESESELRAPRTHLVIDVDERGAHARFCSWDGRAPRPLVLPEIARSEEPRAEIVAAPTLAKA